MYNYPVTVRIHNPEIEKKVDIPLYSSLNEAIDNMSEKWVLEVVNDHLITTARNNIRNNMINDLFKKQ